MTTPRYTRRQVLAGGVGIGAAAALSLSGFAGIRSAGADIVRRAASVKPAGSDLGAVQHVVFLMQENRSFDHYFGALGGVAGYLGRGLGLFGSRCGCVANGLSCSTDSRFHGTLGRVDLRSNGVFSIRHRLSPLVIEAFRI